MDREQLKRAAAARRTSSEPESATRHVRWVCDFCSRDFATEAGFMQHACRAKHKLELLKSPRGQAAYQYYSEWMRLKGRSVPPQETFLESRQFNNFMKFSEWSEKTAIPLIMSFIKLMVETDTQPVLWCRSTTYEMYMQWYNTAFSPEEQFLSSFEKMKEIVIDIGCKREEVYEKLGSAEIIQLIRRRKISPWFLVVSKRFLTWATSLPQAERDDLNQAINFVAYANQLNGLIDAARLMRQACEQEGF